jgi:hypothetical protein
MNASTNGFTFCSAVLWQPVMMKSSAYRTKLTLLLLRLPKFFSSAEDHPSHIGQGWGNNPALWRSGFRCVSNVQLHIPAFQPLPESLPIHWDVFE